MYCACARARGWRLALGLQYVAVLGSLSFPLTAKPEPTPNMVNLKMSEFIGIIIIKVSFLRRYDNAD